MRSIRVFLGVVLLLGLVGCASDQRGQGTGPFMAGYPSDYAGPMKTDQPGWQPG